MLLMVTGALAMGVPWLTANAQSVTGAGSRLGTVNPSAPLYAQLPDTLVEKGQIVAGIIIQEPPTMFVDPQSKTLQGSDIDMLKALSEQLGLPFKLVSTTYGAFVPGLQARRFDMVAAFIADTKQREAVVDFVDYYATRDVALARKAASFHIDSLADLCGHSIAIDQGHYLLPQIMKQKQACEAAGKATMNVDIFRGGPASLQALRTGRSDVVVASGATALYAVKMTHGELKIVSDAIGNPVIVGYAVRKGNTGLRHALKGAFARIMSSGKYRHILEKWGLAAGALNRPYINEGPHASDIVGTLQLD